MSDYARAGEASPVAARPLENIAYAATRVNTATVNVQAFLARFNGMDPAPPAGAEVGPKETPPYRDSLDHLFGAIDRLEQRIEQLVQIG